MKARFVDPFTPNRPIDDPNRFFGRGEAVNELIDSLFQISNSNPKHTIITGDRGVGKSSLLIQISMTAQGDNRLTDSLDVDRGCEKFDFMTVWHDVDSTQDVFTLANAIISKFDSSIKKLWSGINLELDIAGFAKISKSKQDSDSLTELIDAFVERIKKIETEIIKKGKNGIIIFIDELDRIKVDSSISSFFKLTTEKMARDNVKKSGFICAGITGAIQKLEEEHASILRTFRDVPLERFSKDEVFQILEGGFNAVQHKCQIENFQDKSWGITVGLPEPVHLLGSEMLSVDKDGVLDQTDFNNAILKIITDVRKNKLSSLLKKAGGGKYQKILESMSNYEGKIVPLEFISQSLGQERNQFSTNMSNLVEREILFKPQIGYYSFTDPMLKEYIKKFGVLSLEE